MLYEVITANLAKAEVTKMLEDFEFRSLIRDIARLTSGENTPGAPGASPAEAPAPASTAESDLFGTPLPQKPKANVITSYSIHYTKLYEIFCKSTTTRIAGGYV